eukprot:GHUV01010208.1.p1 GENE.GHUV01010208.1~~GHUV01010208.1.p1  ORF type:complete len:237 (+),score=85.24 GHUV01010208.1:146-856(+)
MLRPQYRRIRCSTSGPSRSRPQQRRFLRPNHRLLVVATSEFWWEDEQEFDALTEVLQPKQVYVTTPAAAAKHLQQLKSSTKFVAAFAAPDLKAAAEELWQQLGRAGPPLFLKVRTRDTLQQLEQGPSSSSTAAEQFWQELTSQTWRTELDHGLAGQGADSATAAAAAEQILVIVGDHSSLRRLVTAAVGLDGEAIGADLVAVVEFDNWNQGATQQQLTSWREQLKPKLQQLAQQQR